MEHFKQELVDYLEDYNARRIHAKLKRLAACGLQTTSPFSCLNDFFSKISSNFWGALHSTPLPGFLSYPNIQMKRSTDEQPRQQGLGVLRCKAAGRNAKIFHISPTGSIPLHLLQGHPHGRRIRQPLHDAAQLPKISAQKLIILRRAFCFKLLSTLQECRQKSRAGAHAGC